MKYWILMIAVLLVLPASIFWFWGSAELFPVVLVQIALGTFAAIQADKQD